MASPSSSARLGDHIVDLSHEYSAATIPWPVDENDFQLLQDFAGITENGYFYSSNHFSCPEHCGTHLDAPYHFCQGGKTIEQIPLDQLVAPLVVLNVVEKSKTNPDYQVTVQDFVDLEEQTGKIPTGAIILIRTGFSSFWPDPAKYLGTAKRGESALADLHFPGLSNEAAKWLVEKTKIKAVGLDTASIDYGQSKLFETHRTLCENEILIFENVANIDKVPETGALIIALPMKIKGGTGAPLRIMVTW